MGIAFGVVAIVFAVAGVAMLSDDDKKSALYVLAACFAFLTASATLLLK